MPSKRTFRRVVLAYYGALAQFHQDGHKTEGNTRSAFADLLKKCAHRIALDCDLTKSENLDMGAP